MTQARCACVKARQDVRVLQVGGGPDLTEKSLGADHRGQFGAQHVDRDLAVVLEVLGQIHRGHATLPELTLEGVAIGEACPERVKGHAHPPVGMRGERWCRRPARRAYRFSCACRVVNQFCTMITVGLAAPSPLDRGRERMKLAPSGVTVKD